MPEYTETCAWCGEPAEDGIGLGWALCFECGEIHGMTPPPGFETGGNDGQDVQA